MKNINKIISSLLLLFFVAACTDDFEEINTDPNNPTEVPAENLFTQAQFALADRMWGRAMNFEFGMLMVQHFSQNEYAEDSRYNQQPSGFSASWQSFYAGGLIDLEEAKAITENNEGLADAVRKNRLAQIAITRVWALQIVTDIWGDVPYSEAFNPEEFPNPAYDSQEAIYTGLLAELNAAIALINTDEAGFGSGDIIYGGDMELWGKFANSLKLKIGMRMSDANSSVGNAAVTEALNSSLGLISSNDENALFTFNADQRIANPFYVDAITRDDFCVSEILVTSLKDNGDPRLDEFAKPNSNGNIVGLPYGLTDAESFQLKSVSSRPADDIREATAPAKLMTYAEVEFFKAEAAERNIAGSGAEASYNNAVEASMLDWGLTSADAASYLAANPYAGISSIAYEKWVALYTQGLEAWAESRRLEFDDTYLTLPEAAVIGDIPVRALYPSVELEANTESFEAVGFNNMTTNMWWDVN
ncbi:SusD/RagB family nutrient-binding outer membrane lipoprotein [Fulvivirga sp. RKSG066]|uniref:SusD/RagB family nutrient-binding outer membrane lipoprotein n=1 Tax=Fulvivirga aurantia TaxID=2529383 RepID=UPI0012BB65B7|nr:SusD/RagB family nutrient-binding outer membrane lipoprotein [Fulvivirga aurantia]MTI20932.1 SusD/RagB family nutrient-binding outer membrane lipoprotein [Fulvivirga aurantia]